MITRFYDINGYLWVYDSEEGIVYLPEAEPEVPHEENGYPANSLEEAIRIVNDVGG